MRRGRRIKRAFFFLFLFLFSSLFLLIGEGVEEKKIENYETLYEEMAKDIVRWEKKAVYKTTFEPKEANYEKVEEKAVNKNGVLGNNIDSVYMMYEPTEDGYELSIKYAYSMSNIEYGAAKAHVSFLSNILRNKTPYEIAKFAHDYLILACEYSYSGNSPYDCMLSGRSACKGYALAYKMILEACGVPCEYKANATHAWNTVCLDGGWYNVDVTWDDKGGINIGYDYFLKSNADFPEHKEADATAVASYEYVEKHEGFGLFVFYALSLLSGRFQGVVAIVGIVVIILIKKSRKKGR